MNLSKIREEIDYIDSKILRLLNERMEKSILTRKFKSDVYDKSREDEVLNRIKNTSGKLLRPDFCLSLYDDIMMECKTLQQSDKQIIAYQGVNGAYSEVAAKSWNKDLIPVANKSFADVFNGVEKGIYDFGIVPVENSLGGIVGQVNELFIKTDVHIVGAVDLPIHHCLLSLQDTNYREIKEVYSHPQALFQCKEFIKRNKMISVPYFDTAGSARMLVENKLKNAAVVASHLTADLYNLKIIKENVEDTDTNRTRFFVISKKENNVDGSKSTANFRTHHKAGTLFKVLELFAKDNINLTRIESIPEKPGEFVFFIDFLGSIKDQNVKNVINKVGDITLDFTLLGCYDEKVIDQIVSQKKN